MFLSQHFYVMGAHDQAIAAGQRALALATASEDIVLHALAHRYLGVAYQLQGDYRRAIDCCTQTVASSRGRGAMSALVKSSCPRCPPMPGSPGAMLSWVCSTRAVPRARRVANCRGG